MIFWNEVIQVFHCLEHMNKVPKLPAWWLLVAVPQMGLPLSNLFLHRRYFCLTFGKCFYFLPRHVNKSPTPIYLAPPPLKWLIASFCKFLTTCIHRRRHDNSHTRTPGEPGPPAGNAHTWVSFLMHTPELTRNPYYCLNRSPRPLCLNVVGSWYVFCGCRLVPYCTLLVCLPVFPKAETDSTWHLWRNECLMTEKNDGLKFNCKRSFMIY